MGLKYGDPEFAGNDLLTFALAQELFWGTQKSRATFGASGPDLEISFSDGAVLSVAGYFACRYEDGAAFADNSGVRLGADAFFAGLSPHSLHSGALPAGIEPDGDFAGAAESATAQALAEPCEYGVAPRGNGPENAENEFYVNEARSGMNREGAGGLAHPLPSVTGEDAGGGHDGAPVFSLSSDYGPLVAGTELLELGSGQDMELFIDSALRDIGVDAVLDESLLDCDDSALLHGLAGENTATLRIVGDSVHDAVKVGDGWNQLAAQVGYDGISYDVFENNGEFLLIQNGLI